MSIQTEWDIRAITQPCGMVAGREIAEIMTRVSPGVRYRFEVTGVVADSSDRHPLARDIMEIIDDLGHSHCLNPSGAIRADVSAANRPVLPGDVWEDEGGSQWFARRSSFQVLILVRDRDIPGGPDAEILANSEQALRMHLVHRKESRP